MVTNGELERVGSGRGTKYQLTQTSHTKITLHPRNLATNQA